MKLRYITDFDNPCPHCGKVKFFPKAKTCVYCAHSLAWKKEKTPYLEPISTRSETFKVREKFIMGKAKFEDVEMGWM